MCVLIRGFLYRGFKEIFGMIGQLVRIFKIIKIGRRMVKEGEIFCSVREIDWTKLGQVFSKYINR